MSKELNRVEMLVEKENELKREIWDLGYNQRFVNSILANDNDDIDVELYDYYEYEGLLEELLDKGLYIYHNCKSENIDSLNNILNRYYAEYFDNPSFDFKSCKEQEDIMISLIEEFKEVLFTFSQDENVYNHYLEIVKNRSQKENELADLKNELSEPRMEYMKILVNRALEEMRLQCYKYKRRPFLLNWQLENITFDIKPLTRASGQFKVMSGKLNSVITIDEDLFRNNYLNPSMRGSRSQRAMNRTIIKVLKHELVHAYTYYNFDLFPKGEDLGLCADSSLVNASILYYASEFQETNGYKVFSYIRESDYAKGLEDMSFDKLLGNLHELKLEMLDKKREFEYSMETKAIYKNVFIAGLDFVGDDEVTDEVNYSIGDAILVKHDNYKDTILLFVNVKLSTIYTIDDIKGINEDDIKQFVIGNYADIVNQSKILGICL